MKIIGKIAAGLFSVFIVVLLILTIGSFTVPLNEGVQTNEHFITMESGTAYYTGLVYQVNTKVVYMQAESGYRLAITPYISENGYFCRYIDGEIIEIIN